MKKAIGMFAALVLALAMTGVAVAHWSETLKINGTVNTGVLDAEWSVGESWDDEPENKDVSSITCWVDEENAHKLHVKVTNAYPCINYYQEIDIHNTGTIPLHINGITVVAPDCITVVMPGWENVQLHPSETVEGTLVVHVEQCAEENTTYEFEVTVIVNQWNY